MEEREHICLFPSSQIEPRGRAMRLLVGDTAEPAAALMVPMGLGRCCPNSAVGVTSLSAWMCEQIGRAHV